MWDKLTERSRRIHYKAQEEAHRYGHPSVGTEHLLLGILDEPDCMAARVLATVAGGLESLRVTTVASMPPGAAAPHAHLGFARTARRAMELAQEEAMLESADHIASGHLLLGVLRCQEGGASHVLQNCGVHLVAVREEIRSEAKGGNGGPAGEDGGVAEHKTTKALPPLVRSAIGRSWDHMSYRARAAVEAAMAAAAARGDTMVTPEHLLCGILQDDEGAAARALAQFGATVVPLKAPAAALLQRLGDPRPVDRAMELRNTTTEVIAQAEMAARDAGDGQITTLRLLLGIMARHENAGTGLLLENGITLAALRKVSEDLHKDRAEQQVVHPSELANLTLSQLIVRSRMKGANLSRISDLSPSDIASIFAVTDLLKSRRSRGADDTATLLSGKTLALVFQKPSLRTRVTFEIAMTQLGGRAIHLGPDEIGVGEREAPADVARNLERWVNGIVARTFKHEMIEAFVLNASVPVINGLSDLEHPCQALADLYTMRERYGDLKGLTLAYVGDSNNVTRSLMELAARTGVHMRVASPEGYHFDKAFLDEVAALGQANGAVIEAMVDPKQAVAGADAVYTDVWASMGQESEAILRKQVFADYQLNTELLSLAKPAAIVLHCQPAHRGEEISSDALDSANSAVFDQAENRMHVQKALLALMM